MLFISGMLGRGTLYVTSSTIVDVIETIGCFVFLDAEGDGPVCLTNIEVRAVGAGQLVDTIRSSFRICFG